MEIGEVKKAIKIAHSKDVTDYRTITTAQRVLLRAAEEYVKIMEGENEHSSIDGETHKGSGN